MHWKDRYSREEFVTIIRRLAGAGQSAAEIAKTIGCGTTKNMVIGIVHRARPKIVLHGVGGLNATSHRPSVAPVAPVAAPGLIGTRFKFIILDEVEDFSHSGPVHQDDLLFDDRRCRYPLWPDRIGTEVAPRPFEMFYCGKRTAEGSSWCPDCRAKVYLPPRVVERKLGVDFSKQKNRWAGE